MKRSILKLQASLFATLFVTCASLAEDISYVDGDTISRMVAIKPAAGETVTFTATGSVTMPSSTERTTDYPFALYDSEGNAVWGYNAASDKTMAVGFFQNAVARFAQTVDGATRIDFDKGTFNFASTADGTATAGSVDFLRYPVSKDTDPSPLNSSTLAIHKDASVLFPAFNYYGQTTQDGAALLDVDGGKLEVTGRFQVCPAQLGIQSVRSNTVRVRNGGTLALTGAGKWTDFSTFARIGYAWVSKTDFLLDISGEGSLWDSTATSLALGYRLNKTMIRVSEGATMRLGELVAPNDSYTSPRIIVEPDSTMESSGTVYLGTTPHGNTYEETETTLATTNATLNLSALVLGTNSSVIAQNSDLTLGSLRLAETAKGLFLDNSPLNVTGIWRIDGMNHPEWTFEGLDATIGQLQFGHDGSNPIVTFKDSKLHLTNGSSLGHYWGEARIIIDGDTLVTWETNKSWWGGVALGGMNCGTGRIDLVSGELHMPKQLNTFFFQVGMGGGSYEDSFGQLNVKGGRIVSDDERGTWCGIRLGNGGDETRASGELNVSGGEIYVSLLALEHAPTAATAKGSVVNVSGGSVDCYWIRNACIAGQRSTFNLTGGKVATVRFMGGNGASTFIADGGTLTTADDLAKNAASEKWIEKLSSARVGKKGLTLDVRYPVASSQVFSDMTDAVGEGLIVKKGAATLTQSGALNNAITEITEGQMNYSATTGDTHFKVPSGTMLAFTSAADVSIGGLTLGDENGAGAVTFQLGNTVTIASEPVLTDAVVVLSGTPTVGTFTVLKESGVASAETRAAWEALTLGGGHTEGYSYTFGTTLTESETAFTITIAESAALSDNDYVMPEGVDGVKLWSGKKLDSGVYRFTNGTYAKIETTATATFAADLQLSGWLEVVVPEGETLTLSGNLSGGGIRKTGAGELIISGAHNHLGLGFQLESGTLRYTADGSLGVVAGVTPTMKVASGTIDFGANKAAISGTLTLMNGADTIVTLAGSGDISFSDYAFSLGSIVKLGSGRIELKAASNKTMATVAGTLTVADGDLVFCQTDTDIGLNRTIYIGSDDYTCQSEPCLTFVGGQVSLGTKGDDPFPAIEGSIYVGQSPVKPAAEGLFTSPGLVCSNVTLIVNCRVESKTGIL